MMKSASTDNRVAFIIPYSKKNKYSVYCIVAATEYRLNKLVDVYLIELERKVSILEEINHIYRSGKYRKIVVGFSFRTPQLEYFSYLAKLIKNRFPNILLVAGGSHPSGDPVGTLLRLGFDLVVLGEGEDTIVELLYRYLEEDEWRGIAGTAYVEDDKVVVIRRSKHVDLDSYPPFPYWRNLFCPIEIMRGCTSACRFCQVTYLYGVPRYRSIESILRYAEIKLEKGLRDLRFIAPNALGYYSSNGIKPSHSELEELLYRLRLLSDRYGARIFFGSFPSEVRPDSIDKDTVAILRKYVDNERIIVGVQSGSNRVLKLLNRNHTVEDGLNAIELLRSAGFRVDVDIILGLPYEDEDDLEQTILFIDKAVKMGAKIHLHYFMPLPGTPLEDTRPREIPINILKRIAKLIGIGFAYGEWEHQKRIANYIVGLREKGLIVDKRHRQYFIKHVLIR